MYKIVPLEYMDVGFIRLDDNKDMFMSFESKAKSGGVFENYEFDSVDKLFVDLINPQIIGATNIIDFYNFLKENYKELGGFTYFEPVNITIRNLTYAQN